MFTRQVRVGMFFQSCNCEFFLIAEIRVCWMVVAWKVSFDDGVFYAPGGFCIRRDARLKVFLKFMVVSYK